MPSPLIAPGTKLMYQFSCDGAGAATFYSDSQGPTVDGFVDIGMRVVVTSDNDFATIYDLKTTSSNSDGSLSSEVSQGGAVNALATLSVKVFEPSTTYTFSLNAPANCTGAVEVTY